MLRRPAALLYLHLVVLLAPVAVDVAEERLEKIQRLVCAPGVELLKLIVMQE